MTKTSTLAVIGGTGALGSGLARRWAVAGYRVLIGSRSADKARQAAAELAELGQIEGLGNHDAARQADVSILAVPYSHQEPTLKEIAPALEGKLLITAVVPLMPPKVSAVQLPAAGSAAAEARAMLPQSVTIVSAFQNVAAAKLHEPGPVECDILVAGDNREARDRVLALVEAAGLRGVDIGALANSAATEALTSALIAINRRYKVPGAGLRITGLGGDN